MSLLKNSLALYGIINYLTHWYIFTIFTKKHIILDLKFDSLLFEGIKFLGIQI